MDIQGKSLSFLVNFGSTHSFISPKVVELLKLKPIETRKKLRASLANGTEIKTPKLIVDLPFKLQSQPTFGRFRVMTLGKFQGLLGMDWLGSHDANL